MALARSKRFLPRHLALRGDGTHLVPLDACIETMRQTGLDMIRKIQGNIAGWVGGERAELLTTFARNAKYYTTLTGNDPHVAIGFRNDT